MNENMLKNIERKWLEKLKSFSLDKTIKIIMRQLSGEIVDVLINERRIVYHVSGPETEVLQMDIPKNVVDFIFSLDIIYNDHSSSLPKGPFTDLAKIKIFDFPTRIIIVPFDAINKEYIKNILNFNSIFYIVDQEGNIICNITQFEIEKYLQGRNLDFWETYLFEVEDSNILSFLTREEENPKKD